MSETAILGLAVVALLLLSKKQAPPPPPATPKDNSGGFVDSLLHAAEDVFDWFMHSNSRPGPSSNEEAQANANEHQGTVDANAANGAASDASPDVSDMTASDVADANARNG